MEPDFEAAVRELMEAIRKFQVAANEELQADKHRIMPRPYAKGWIVRSKVKATQLEILLLGYPLKET